MNAVFIAAMLLVSLSGARAQVQDLRLPVIIDADRTDFDGKSSMLRFTGLRLTQGGIGIQADIAHANRMDFDESTWKFSGNVVFDVNEGHVTCDEADLTFSNFQLLNARVKGSPATFRFIRSGNETSTYAEASELVYNVAEGIIEFSGDAKLSEGDTRIEAKTLVYNINEQRIIAASSGDGDDRVNVVYSPEEAGAGDGRDDENASVEEDTGTENPERDDGA